MRLLGKVALITGAATGVEGHLMGFGGAAARQFAREGSKVVVSDIDEGKGETTAAQVRESGGDAVFVRLDVTREPEWIEAVRLTVSHFGRLDILVNNAGSVVPGNVEDTTVEAWDAQMAVHARGAFLGTKHAIPEMRKAGGGSIINMSSIGGLVGTNRSPSYHAAKGAVRLFTKAAAVQYAKEGIRVNSVHPGFVLTPMTEKIFADEARLEYRLAGVPIGCLGSVEEVVNGILYLASDEASFVTGAELVIDGGMTAQ